MIYQERFRTIWIGVLVLMLLSLVIVGVSCTMNSSSTTAQAITPSPSTSGIATSAGPAGAPPSGSPPRSGPPSGAPGAGAVNFTQPTVNMGTQNKLAKGNGTVTVAKYANLYFGSAGQITAINVALGDKVTQGQILAKLDTSNLAASVAQYQASIVQINANIAQNQQTLLQDQASLVKALQNLAAQQDVQNIQNQIDNTNIQLQYAKQMLSYAAQSPNTGDVKYWTSQITFLSSDTRANSGVPHKEDGGLIGILTANMTKLLLDPLNAGATVVSSATTADQIQQYILAIQSAQAKIITDQANMAVYQANLTTSQKNLQIYQQQINQATIVCPFDGIVAAVNQSSGDTIGAPSQSAKPILYIFDPTTLQLAVNINELDLPNVKIGQKAKVMINAYPGTSISGNVIAISPTSIVVGGIVNYTVTISFTAPPNTDVRIGMNASAEITNQ
jgi:multidrug resistance efflux pump